MSVDSAKACLAALKTNKDLLDKVNKAKTVDEKIKAAKQAGFTFTAEEFAAARGKAGELSDAELETVAGGCGIEYCTLDGW